MTRQLAGILALLALGAACGKSDQDKPARAIPANAPSSTAMEKWDHIDYASTVIPAADLAPLPLGDLQRIRGIVFGRHGRVFQDSTLQRWLVSRPWYHPDGGFTNARLTARERENLDRVREAESARHAQIEPGDMRFYQTRVITTAMLGHHNPQDWEVLEAEVLANHGYVFEENGYHEDDGSRSLDAQGYFDERYWYERKPEFSADQLSATEQQNLDTITVAVTRQLGRVLSPGMMNLFQSTALTEEMLAKVSIADLRLLRNEVYARHGRPFRTPWLAQEFRMHPWYKPRADYSDAELSPVERANIALITAREQRMHESLATDELSVSDVRGLRPDDARRLRNEIFARHGRRFRDTRLQSYFASFAWYKPSDAFREDQLNATERKNADLISQYESGKFTEG
jgi:hypothetical protein